MGSGRAPAAATAVPGGRLGTLRAGALPGAAPPARWARASPPLFNAAAAVAVLRSSPSPKTRGRCFTFTFRESLPSLASSFGTASASVPMPVPGRDYRPRCPACRGPVGGVLVFGSAASPAWGSAAGKADRRRGNVGCAE